MSPVSMVRLKPPIVSPMNAYRGENMEFAGSLQSLPETPAESRFDY
jgi:hypothetical protein